MRADIILALGLATFLIGSGTYLYKRGVVDGKRELLIALEAERAKSLEEMRVLIDELQSLPDAAIRKRALEYVRP